MSIQNSKPSYAFKNERDLLDKIKKVLFLPVQTPETMALTDLAKELDTNFQHTPLRNFWKDIKSQFKKGEAARLVEIAPDVFIKAGYFSTDETGKFLTYGIVKEPGTIEAIQTYGNLGLAPKKPDNAYNYEPWSKKLHIDYHNPDFKALWQRMRDACPKTSGNFPFDLGNGLTVTLGYYRYGAHTDVYLIEEPHTADAVKKHLQLDRKKPSHAHTLNSLCQTLFKANFQSPYLTQIRQRIEEECPPGTREMAVRIDNTLTLNVGWIRAGTGNERLHIFANDQEIENIRNWAMPPENLLTRSEFEHRFQRSQDDVKIASFWAKLEKECTIDNRRQKYTLENGKEITMGWHQKGSHKRLCIFEESGSLSAIAHEIGIPTPTLKPENAINRPTLAQKIGINAYNSPEFKTLWKSFEKECPGNSTHYAIRLENGKEVIVGNFKRDDNSTQLYLLEDEASVEAIREYCGKRPNTMLPLSSLRQEFGDNRRLVNALIESIEKNASQARGKTTFTLPLTGHTITIGRYLPYKGESELSFENKEEVLTQLKAEAVLLNETDRPVGRKFKSGSIKPNQVNSDDDDKKRYR